MYNKNQFKKVNDKKVLHKIKKHWAVLSVALLGLIGGGAVTTANASANTNTNANNQSNNTQSNQQVNTNQLQQQQPKLVNNQINQNNGSNQSAQSSNINQRNQSNSSVTSNTSSSIPSSQSIVNRANQLHSHIVNQALTTQQKPVTTHTLLGGSSNPTKAPNIVQTGKWDNINVNYWSNDTMELTGNGTITNNNIPSLPFNFDKNDWTLKIDKTNADVNLSNNVSWVFNSKPIFSHFKSMNLTGVHTSDVTNMSNMFSGLDNLQALDISSFNTSNATNMNSMFDGDSNLQNVNIDPNIFNTSKVTDMSDMFQWDSNLQNIDTSKFVTNNVRNFNGMFNGDRSIKYLDLSNFDTYNASDMQHMFSSDNNLIEVTLGSKTDLNRNQSWSDSYNEPFFNNNVNSDNQNTTSAIKDGTAPAGNYYLYGHAPEINNHNAYTNTYDGLTYKYNPSNKSLEFTNGQLNWNGNGNNSFIGTNDNAPSDINKATTIIFDSSVKVGNVTNMSNMFANNSSVQSIILHSFNTTNVKNMSNMFKNDTSLKNLTLSKYFNTTNRIYTNSTPANVIQMSDMFANDNALQKVNIQSYLTYFNKSAKLMPLYKVLNDHKHTELISSNLINTKNSYLQSNIGQYLTRPKAIKGTYDGLNYEYDPVNRYLEFTSGSLTWNGNPSNDAFIGAGSHTHHNLRNAQSIKFDKGINMSHVTDMHNMFNDNHSIRSLDLSDLDTSRVTNMNGMFQNDPNLTSLNINGWNTRNVNNMGWMFYNDKDLSNLDLSSFDTHNVTNMDDMFNIGRNISDNYPLALNISNFDTRNVKSMDDLFSNTNNDYFPSRITIGANTKFLNDALHFGHWTTNSSDSTPFVSPTTNSDIHTIGYDEFLYNQEGNNETNNLYNNILPSGTYYLVKPSSINLIVNHSNNKHSTFTINGIFTSSDSDYNTNVIESQIKKALSKSNVLNKDYTVNPSDYTITPVSNRSYWSYVLNDITLPVKENYKKDIHDANTVVKSDLNKVSQFINNSDQQSIQWLNSLNDDYTKEQHMLSEPMTWPIANDANSIENDANSNLSNIIVDNRSDISNTYNNISNISNDINNVSNNKNVKADSNVTSGINNDKNIAEQAINLIKNDYANPTMPNVNNANYELQQVSNADSNANNLQDQANNYVYAKAHPKAPNIPSTPSTQSEINSYFTSLSASVSASVSGMQSDYNSEIGSLNSEISSHSTNSNTSTTNSDSSEISSLSNAVNSMEQNSNVPENTINDASLQSSFSNYINNDNTEINSLTNKINSMEQTTPTNDANEINTLSSEVQSQEQNNTATDMTNSSLQSSYNSYVSDTNAEITSLNNKISGMPQNNNEPMNNNNSALNTYVSDTNNEINSLTNRINTMPQSNPVNIDESALQASYSSYMASTSAEISSLANQLNNSASNASTNPTTAPNPDTTSNLNELSVGQGTQYRNGIVTRKSMHYNMITIDRTCLLHNHMFSVGQVTDYAGVLKRGTTVQIVKSFSFKVGNHKAYRYEVNLNGHNYFVTANPMFTINTYIMPTEVKKHNRAVITKPCFMYLHGHRHLLRHGNSVHIKRVLHYGKITRLQLTNGAVITANKKFVKLI